MGSLEDYIYGAGLIPVAASEARISNSTFPVARLSDGTHRLKAEQLFCDRPDHEAPAATVLFFTLPGCENCRPSAQEFARLADMAAANPAVDLCLRFVVSDWPSVQEIRNELQTVTQIQPLGLVWDQTGVLAERLAVLGQPALYFLDAQGRVGAYRNGPVSFVSPGFQSFWQIFSDVNKKQAKNEAVQASWVDRVREEVPVMSTTPVSFLNTELLPAVWLVGLTLLCYSLGRFVLQLRKNFRGSQNRS